MSTGKELFDAATTMHISRAAMIGFVAADTVGLGALAIYLCWPELFVSMEFSKLVLLSVAITSPPLALGTFLYHIMRNRHDYAQVEIGLKESLTFGISIHLLATLLQLAGMGMAAVAPLGPTIPKSTVYWLSQGWFVILMLCAGLRVMGHKKVSAAIGLLPPVGWLAFKIIRALLSHFGWAPQWMTSGIWSS